MSVDIDRGVLAGTGYDRSTIYPSLQSLAEAVLDEQESKRDYIVDTRTMTFSTSDDGMTDLSWDDPEGGVDGGAVSGFAHGQIAEALKIPKGYYDRMRDDNPGLLDTNVQSWFQTEPKRRMVRMLKGNVRAYLSDRYRRLDNVDLLENAILPTLGEIDGLHFQVASLTPERLQINALLPGLERDVNGRGDIVQAGVAIVNSEVGKGKLKVAPRVWRLACLNGLLVDALALGAYHVGRAADAEAYAIWEDDTLAADDTAFFLKVRDAVKAALSTAQFETIVQQMREAADPFAPKIVDPVEAAKRLTSRYDLGEKEQASFLRHLAEGGDLTKWGAVNALTAAAKDSKQFERGAEMEALGGRLLGETSKDWAAMVAV